MPESFDNTQVNRARRSLLSLGTSAFAAVGAAFAAVPFISSFRPSERAKAIGAPVEVDIGAIAPGQLKVVEWRGKPVWLFRRDQQALQSLSNVKDLLADPDSANSKQPEYVDKQTRALKSELAVLVGVCTHLGCSPSFRPDPKDPAMEANWQGGFLCACHGSKFDLAGRVFKNMPAPTNLEVPPYRFKDEQTVVIGEDSNNEEIA